MIAILHSMQTVPGAALPWLTRLPVPGGSPARTAPPSRLAGKAGPLWLHSQTPDASEGLAQQGANANLTASTPSEPPVSQASDNHDERAEHHALMRRIADGDERAFRALSDRFIGPISGFATRLLGNPTEGEDVAQETFLRVWKHAPRYSPDAAVSTWIYRIARNLCLDRLRRRRPQSDRISQLDGGAAPHDLLADKQLSEAVQTALQALPERQQTALTLTHYQGLSQAEAALVLEVSVEALESLLARARRSLRKRLKSTKAQLDAAQGAGGHP